jgi:trigger factor
LTPTETTEMTSEQENAAETQPSAQQDHDQQDHVEHDHAEHDHAEHDHTHSHEIHAHQTQPTLNPELMREISVEVDAETVSKAFRRVLKNYSKQARIPGFRVGKVPEGVIRNRFAKEVRQEVLDELVSARFQAQLAEEKIQPVSQPQLTNLMLVEGQPLQFKAAFEVLPAVDVSGYESTPVKKVDTSLSDAEYDAEMARVMDQHATVEPVEEDRPLTDGDWAEIQFTGDVQPKPVIDGQEAEPMEPIEGEDVLIEIGGANTLTAFTEALRGRKVGDEMDFEVTYPDDFGEPRLASQTVKYNVTLKALKKKTYPEKDEEFARQLGGYDNWEDFEGKLREMAAGRKKSSLEAQAKEVMVSAWIERFQFPVPETFVQSQIDARLDRGLRALAQQGMTADDMRKLDFNRLREAQRDQAISEVKASLILDKIADAEGITVADDEMERELLMASIQSREPLDTLRERMAKDGSIDRMREQMRREKTATAVYEKLAA